MEPVSRGARLHLVSHRRGALLADESAIDEPGQVERSDEIRRPLRGDELGIGVFQTSPKGEIVQ